MVPRLTNADNFVHSGTVSKVEGGTVTVMLDRNVHCDSCRVKAACGMGQSKSKEMQIPDPEGSFILNEQVKLVIGKSRGLTAVFWAYVFPFILVMGVLLVSSIYLPEWQAGLAALLVLLPYYFVLHLLKENLEKKYRISVFKMDFT